MNESRLENYRQIRMVEDRIFQIVKLVPPLEIEKPKPYFKKQTMQFGSSSVKNSKERPN